MVRNNDLGHLLLPNELWQRNYSRNTKQVVSLSFNGQRGNLNRNWGSSALVTRKAFEMHMVTFVLTSLWKHCTSSKHFAIMSYVSSVDAFKADHD